MNHEGLTTSQVEERIKQGRVNRTPKKNQTTIKKIILKNSLTIFNLVNLILALMIILVGAYKNLLFITIAIANTLISIVNGIRAKKTVDKMRLVSEQKPTVIRDGNSIQISSEEIVDGDLLVFSLGDQIIVDAEVKEGIIEVNESFITGEQDNIEKHPGEKLISGSFVVSGTCKATATAVGENNFINKLEQNARTIKTADSKLFTLMNNIVKYISYGLIPIGVLLLWSRFRVADTTTEIAVTSTVAGLINMIPEGLILLTSSVLALATIRLSRKKVLVQDLYSIETLARVDTICLDKTGTLTTGKMKVKEIIPATPNQKNALETALKLILSNSPTENATSTALKEKLLKRAKFESREQIEEIIPFSSERKYSGIRTNKATYLMGAPEYLTDNTHDFPGTYRIIAVVKGGANMAGGRAGGSPIEALDEMGEAARSGPARMKLLGYVLLEDEIRKDAGEIVDYFYENDVDIKIISGDNLATVQNIARTVGVKTAENGVDLSKLKNPDYSKLVKENTIFARVKPSQKKSLITALKKQGRTIAMTGDGVNDILAMKEADCSIAIGEGSDAARRSAKLVLLDNDFGSVPSIIDEGRQSINNLERSATLFLSKTTYAAILAVLFVIIPIEYPFAPLEMSLLNFACIGLPGVILALEKNTSRIKNRFTKNILNYSVPIGITVSITMLTLAIISSVNDFSRSELISMSAIITFAIDFALIFSISRPINPLRSALLGSIIGIFAAVFIVPLLRNFLDFTFLSQNGYLLTIILIGTAYAVFIVLHHIAKRQIPKILKKYPKLQI